jgi:hypothetical protein
MNARRWIKKIAVYTIALVACLPVVVLVTHSTDFLPSFILVYVILAVGLEIGRAM